MNRAMSMLSDGAYLPKPGFGLRCQCNDCIDQSPMGQKQWVLSSGFASFSRKPNCSTAAAQLIESGLDLSNTKRIALKTV